MSNVSNSEKCTAERCTGYCLTVGVRRCPAGKAAFNAEVSREIEKKQTAAKQQLIRETAVA